MPSTSKGEAVPAIVDRLLGRHGIAAVVLRDGAVLRANECAHTAVTRAGADEPIEELEARLSHGLTVHGDLDGLAPGEQRPVAVELVTPAVLLQRQGVATRVGAQDDPAVLVTFPVTSTDGVDPSHVERLETMLETTADIITVVDTAGRIRYSNAAAGRLTGLGGEEVNGAPYTDLVHPVDVAEATDAFARAVAGEAVGPVELRLRFADGGWRHVEAEVADRVTVDGIESYVVTVRDVSERIRRLEEQRAARRLLEALVENIEDVIVVLGPSMEVQWASPGIDRLVDAPAYTNIGEHALNDIHPDDAPGVAEQIQLVVDQPEERRRVEFRLNHRRLGWRWVEAFVVNRLDDPAIGGLVCTLRDITEQRDVDVELRRLHEQDRAEVARLREADRLKDLFLATVSHELRTPLSSVRGFSAVLERQGETLDDASRADMVARIHANAREMEEMVERILELSRLQAGRVNLTLEPLELREVVPEVVDHLKHALGDHEVVLDVGPSRAIADRHALDHVLRNLLTNAARYSDAGTTIDVITERHGDEVVLHVRDQGSGIASEDQGRIFQSFYQAVPTKAGRRGTGIGLNIARRYAQLQSGRLSLESEPGRGSTFSLWLPAAD